MGTIIFIILFKIISESFLQIFHVLFDSWNIFTESNELSAIYDYEDIRLTSQVGSRKVFIFTASDQYEPNTRFWLLSQIVNSKIQ